MGIYERKHILSENIYFNFVNKSYFLIKKENIKMKKILVGLLIFIYALAFGADRSNKWTKVRAAFIKTHNVCAVCGSGKSLQVHHIKPFHMYPELELDPNNLITLCTSKYAGFNCHLSVGHCGNYKWENTYILEDVKILHDLILKYKGYTVLPDEIAEYLKYIHEMKKYEMSLLKEMKKQK